MNATIQVLSNILILSEYLLEKFKASTFDINTQPLSISYSSLLFELFYANNNKNYIAPRMFKEIIGELNPLFKGMHAADSKDLIFFIIEKLHQELSLNQKQQQIQPIDFAQQEKNAQNENLMLQLFYNDYQLRNNSRISEIFYGVNRSIMKCNGCGITKYSFQTFNLLIFQLKKVKEEKYGYMTNVYEKINLLDAFIIEQKEEILKGENMIYCNTCHGLREGIHKQNILRTPPVLIIILNRGKNNQDFNEEFEFPTILDLTGQNIVLDETSYLKYYLCGIITHLGESGTSGHFIAYCRSEPNSNFFCYNDASVVPVKEEEAIKANISTIEYKKKTPYILIYHTLDK